MKKNVVILSVVLALLLFVTVLSPQSAGDGRIIEQIEKYGWKVGKLCEKAEVQIPEKFDTVYTRYNEIQKKSGFDLSAYRGKKTVRYTYEIKNHKNSDNVYVNVLTYCGKIIAADIMTRDMGGFMHEITRKEYIK